LVLPEAPPDHSTISRTRRLIDLETLLAGSLKAHFEAQRWTKFVDG
jgi:hypothetical protein